ncbi:N-acetylmuramoyl-L-alanine amidase [Xylanibacillus composti]|uniref:N-acetylmuramoyl-L-alanine amidase n=1 Tax=Xylanibacillus composti TaxID=1572762 RepID=UPI001BCB4CE6|nr:N-acetylmuramoyl-L-alanine amidase [Xylanibacillus composti]
MRKFPLIWFILAALVCVFPTTASASNSDLTLYVDGEKQELLHPLLFEGQHVYIAVDAAAKQFSLKGESQTAAELTISGTTYRFQEDERTAAHGQSQSEMKAPALVRENTFYVPLSFVADKLSMRLSWDAWTRSASLYKKSNPVSTPAEKPSAPAIVQDSKVIGAGNKPSVPGELSRLKAVKLEGGRLSVQTSSPVDVQPLYLSDPAGSIPDRLVLDVPYAVLEEQIGSEGTGSIDHPLVSQVRYAQFSHDPSIVRIVLDLKQPVAFQVETGAENGFAVSLQNNEGAGNAVYRVVIDAGHGGKDPGATGLSKREEKEFNLNVAKKVQAVLANYPQVSVRMTRDDDTFISLDDRVKLANEWPADVFVSIHANTFERPISGTETYFWNDNSKTFADLIHKRLIETSGFEDRGVRKTAFKVIRETEMPAVLLEIGYLTNAEQEKILLDNSFQDKIALTIANSILEYFNQR